MVGTGVKRKSGKVNNSNKYLECEEWIDWKIKDMEEELAVMYKVRDKVWR